MYSGKFPGCPHAGQFGVGCRNANSGYGRLTGARKCLQDRGVEKEHSDHEFREHGHFLWESGHAGTV